MSPKQRENKTHIVLSFYREQSCLEFFFQRPQENQRERGISNQVAYSCDKLYCNLLHDQLPRDKKVPGQSKSGLFTRFHRTGLRTEGEAIRTRVKYRRGNNSISGCDRHVISDKNRDNKESGEIFCKKSHQRDQEDNEPLLGPHPLQDELHPHLLRQRVL